MNILKKAFSGRFGFDILRTSQIHLFVKDKATGNASCKVYSNIRLVDDVQPQLYSIVSEHIVYKPFVGLIRVARFDEQGNAKAFRMWNERQELAPRFFRMG